MISNQRVSGRLPWVARPSQVHIGIIFVAAVLLLLMGCVSQSETSRESTASTIVGNSLTKPFTGEAQLMPYEYTLTEETCDARFGEFSGSLNVTVLDSGGFRTGSVRVVAMGLRDGKRVQASQDVAFVGRDIYGLLAPTRFNISFTEQITDCKLWYVFMN